MTHANRICVLFVIAARLALAAEAEPELLRLAKDHFQQVSPAEHRELTLAEEMMFRAAATGSMVVCTDEETKTIDPGKDDECREEIDAIDPDKVGEWGHRRSIRAECIQWLCTDKAAAKLVSYRGIQVVGARIDGKLDLTHAPIPFPLTFAKCSFGEAIVLDEAALPALYLEGTHTRRIVADGLKVERCVFLRYGFRAEGDVRLLGATIGGDLDCTRGHFRNEGRDALRADRLEVGGNVRLCEGFVADGRVSLASAKVLRSLLWHGVESPGKATLDLRSARVGILWDEEASWPLPENLFLHGFEYGELDDKALLGADARKRWLGRQPDDQFYPQPYEQLAKVLRQQGREEDAKQILIAKNDERVRLAKMSWYGRLWHRFLGWSLGYGYRPWRPLWGALAFLIFGVVLFGWGYHKRLMRAKEGSLDRTFNLVVYTMDLFVPVVNFHQAEAWWPDAEEGRWGWWLRVYAWTHMAAGWVITTLLIVGLTGLVRR